MCSASRTEGRATLTIDASTKSRNPTAQTRASSSRPRAEIAKASGVPAGNIYYHFKTRDDLIAAVVDTYLTDVTALLTGLDAVPGPAERLKALIGALTANAGLAAEQGCPIGGLCTELSRRDDTLHQMSTALLNQLIAWIRRQFEELGRDDADELSYAFLASYQGIALLTHAFNDPNLMERESQRVQRWIDTLRPTDATP